MAAYCFSMYTRSPMPRRMEEYRSRVLAAVKHYGGRYLAVGGRCRWWKAPGPVLPVLIEFLNLERAKAWYGSDQYKELKELRLSATKADAVFIESGPNEFDGHDVPKTGGANLVPDANFYDRNADWRHASLA
jgi:uncharacterized protein (DUF1330 family)